MKSTRTRIVVISTAILLTVAAAIGQGMYHHRGHGGDFNHMIGFYTRALDLTADQQTQMKAIWAKEKPGLQPLMTAMHQNRADMKALEASGPFDENKTRALASANAQTMIELQVQHARIKAELVQLLTADQKTKLAQIEAKHEAHMQQHMAPAPTE